MTVTVGHLVNQEKLWVDGLTPRYPPSTKLSVSTVWSQKYSECLGVRYRGEHLQQYRQVMLDEQKVNHLWHLY